MELLHKLKSISQSPWKNNKKKKAWSYSVISKKINSKDLTDSYISHDEFFSVNKVLRGYNEMKKEIENPETSAKYTIWIWLI